MIDILMFILFVLCLLIYVFRTRRKNLPPGPWRIPLIGTTIFFKPHVHETLTTLSKQYGNIFHIYIGSTLVVVLNDNESIKEALVTKGDYFTGRPHMFLIDYFTQNKGIIFSTGKNWKEQRRFALHILRDFGFGRTGLENRIMVEVNHIVEAIASQNGKSFQCNHLFDKATANVICSLAFDRRFDYDDPLLEKLLTMIEVLFVNSGMLNPLNYFPILRFFSLGFRGCKQAILETRSFLNKIINEHKETFDPESPRDFIDTYILRIKEDELKEIKDSTFTTANLIKTIEDLFFAGTETTSTTILWGILHLMYNPDKQRKIHEEIDQVVGNSRPISLEDRSHLPYTEASIQEIQRHANLVPLSIAHKADQDVNLFNYSIPKGTVIIPNLWAAHHNSKVWPNSHEFKPERFLNEKGQVIKNAESFMPFSAGKRICLGESLAKMELFLILGNLLQRFRFEKESSDLLPSLTKYMEGAVLKPYPYNISAKIR